MRLVVRAPNWLGDVIMALPALAAIRAHFGGAPLHVAASAALAPVFTAVPDVGRVLSLPPDLRGEIATLAAGEFDAVLLLPNSFRAAWVAWRAGIRERWGYRTDWRGVLLTRAVPRPRRHRLRRTPRLVQHHAEYFLDLVRGLGMATPSPLAARLVPPPSALARGRALLEAHGADPERPLVAFAPGAAYGHAKRWPPAHFAALALKVWRERGVRTVLVGSLADRDAALEIESRVSSAASPTEKAARPLIDLVGRTDLATLLGVLRACRLAVSNDSGAMHVAAALGVKVVALFGPTDERATSPLGPHVILTNPVWCRPCLLRECPIDHRCLRGLVIERVWQAVAAELDAGGGLQ